MKISFEIEPDEAIIALMYELGLGERITSNRQFRTVLTNYFRLNGLQCQDDHESENEPHREQAQVLCNKYFHA